jgi:SPW repeat
MDRALRSKSERLGRDHAGADFLSKEQRMRKWRDESVLDIYNFLLASVLLILPWFLVRASEAARIDLRVSAAAIICLSLAAMVAFSYWEEWANLALGLWLVASPWLLGFAHTRAMHFAIGIGAAVAFLAGIELFLRYEAAERQSMPSATPAASPANKNPAG